MRGLYREGSAKGTLIGVPSLRPSECGLILDWEKFSTKTETSREGSATRRLGWCTKDWGALIDYGRIPSSETFPGLASQII